VDNSFSRRTFIAGAAAAGSAVLLATPAAVAQEKSPYTLPKLEYAYDALEPHIDAKTMEIHHSKHHAKYIENANKALEKIPELAAMSPADVLKNVSKAPEADRQTLINNVGGHVNHALFWQLMAPGKGGEPKGALADAIKGTFGDFGKFKDAFADAGAKRFGSGWAWLCKDPAGKLTISSTANQDVPTGTPVLGIDVWEHAYYLKYQNLRADYIKAWWNVVNWEKANALFTGK
jgi:Fe-Mn family superoxide dismutase